MAGYPVSKEKKRTKHDLSGNVFAWVLQLAYAVCIFYFIETDPSGIFIPIKRSLLFLFFLCYGILFCVTLYIEQRMDLFLREIPFLESREMLERLKPLLRMHMYVAVLVLFLGGNVLVFSFLVYVNGNLIQSALVFLFCLILMPVSIWTARTEKKFFSIECKDHRFDNELDLLIKNWSTHVFPNF